MSVSLSLSKARASWRMKRLSENPCLSRDSLVDAERHHHIKERNRTTYDCRRRTVVEFDCDLILINSLERILHVGGIEYDFYFLPTVLDRNNILSFAYIGCDGGDEKLVRIERQTCGRRLFHHHDACAVDSVEKKLAVNLLELYAKREKQEGFRYAEDTVWQKEFEDSFPYEETPDQLKAIADIKRDMEMGKIMDRLLVGDVGFGKTEVAFRAMFKTILDAKQAVLIAPTTILARQHYENLKPRLKEFGIDIYFKGIKK